VFANIVTSWYEHNISDYLQFAVLINPAKFLLPHKMSFEVSMAIVNVHDIHTILVVRIVTRRYEEIIDPKLVSKKINLT